ncbi:NAD-dependent epimerase/dehydratase family protein [Dictyobacter aurantiacus]|uniref:UDP-glucose 4-epimerase n=1 Tax=Dictyobacter aurantiacus TaxID=1936993 RepID=A0A401ZHU8_9CHLR|nr:NAD-dependent epimerase/dehydratase family protein [Dictyobacter aurantiacus]GCE06398.1 UDP-glucose 4-epimerase [Dictyobacter aurantiacus]
MKIAITGGAGFVGSQLARAYLDAGHDVFVIDSLATGSRQTIDPRARFYQIDVRDSALRQLLQGERPDIVSHHAAQQHEPGTAEHALTDADVHVRGLINVLDSCVSASVTHFVFASSGNSMYEPVDSDQLPLNEEHKLYPRSAHDISKVAGEWYVRYYSQQYGLTHTIVRYADIYGEGNSPRARHPLSYFIQMLMQRQRSIIYGTGNELRDHIFIDDIIRAHLLMIKNFTRTENITMHLSSGHGYSLNKLYHMAAAALESDIEPIYLGGPYLKASSVILDNTRARHILGWQPQVSLSEGVRMAVGRLLPGKEMQPQRLTPQPAPVRLRAATTLTRA